MKQTASRKRQPGRGAKPAPKRRSASRLTVLILLVLVAALTIQIVRMNGQIQAALAEEVLVCQRLEELQKANQQLQDDLDHSTDPTLIENIARDQLGMVCPGERSSISANSRKGGRLLWACRLRYLCRTVTCRASARRSAMTAPHTA